MSKIITRESAAEAGLVYYFLNVACKHGHVAERYVKSAVCRECHAIAVAKSSEKYRAEKAAQAQQKAEIKKKHREETRPEREAAMKAKRQAYRAEWKRKNAARVKAVNDIWREKNAEKMTNTTTEWRKKHPEKVRAYTAAWAARNPEKETARWAAQYAKDPERNKKKCAEWRKNNPDKLRIYSQNYRANKEASGEKLSFGLAEKLFKLQRGKCACCGLPLGDDYHMDHIIPLKLGGPNNDANIQLLRQRCNGQKNAKHPIDFMQSRGFLL